MSRLRESTGMSLSQLVQRGAMDQKNNLNIGDTVSENLLGEDDKSAFDKRETVSNIDGEIMNMYNESIID